MYKGKRYTFSWYVVDIFILARRHGGQKKHYRESFSYWYDSVHRFAHECAGRCLLYWFFFQRFSMNLRMKNVQHIWSTDYRVQTNNYERAFLKHLLSDMIFLFAFLFCIWGWRIRCVPHDSLLLCHRWKYSFFGMMCCRKFRGAIRVFFFDYVPYGWVSTSSSSCAWKLIISQRRHRDLLDIEMCDRELKEIEEKNQMNY